MANKNKYRKFNRKFNQSQKQQQNSPAREQFQQRHSINWNTSLSNRHSAWAEIGDEIAEICGGW